jgi:hypothetical protein
MRLQVRLLFGLASVCLAAGAVGQSSETPQQLNLTPASTPPLIAFPDWRQTDDLEFGTEYDVEFPSAYVSGSLENDRVPLKVMLPSDGAGPYPVVLILHYWGATDLRAEFSLASDLNERGIAAAIMTLPYHLERTPPGHRSGDLAVPGDTPHLLASVTQAALDVKRSVDFLTSRKEFQKDKIGIVGTSLGALVAALSYGVEPRIGYSAFVLGGADLAHIIWTSSRVVPQRDALRRAGYTEDKLREALKPVEPLTYLPRANPGPSFVIGAQYDTVIPPSATRELLAALPGATSIFIDTGHYGGIFVERKVLREVASFFSTTMGNKSFLAPRSLYAPTIRVGGILDTFEGVDVGAGIDLVQFDPLGNTFLNLFFAPRGPELILGHKLAFGFAIAGTASTRGSGVGLFWSTVL